MKKSKIIATILVVMMLCTSYFGLFCKVEAGIVSGTDATKYNFNAEDVRNWSSGVGAGIENFDDVESDLWPFEGTTITSDKLASKEIIALNLGEFNIFQDNQLDASDAAYINGIAHGKDDFKIIPQLVNELGINEQDITVTYTINMPEKIDIDALKSAITTFIENNDSVKTSLEGSKFESIYMDLDDLEIPKSVTYTIGKETSTNIELNKKFIILYNCAMFTSEKYKEIYDGSYYGSMEDWFTYKVMVDITNGNQTKQLTEPNFTNLSATATLSDGTEYKLVVGKNGEEYVNNWYLLRTKQAEQQTPVIEFETELEYIAIIEGKDVGGELKEGTFYPGYDVSKEEKDADVTAIITSTTGNDIVQVNDKALKEDGTPNEDGWYYLDVNNKKVVAKDYPFDDYDNLEDNGIVVEKGVKLTSIDGLEDTQDVSIRWPFRIIQVTQDPEKIEEDTDKVRVEITTNLPIEEEKLPDGWKFTDDDEGKTQHRVYREFEKGEVYDKDVILTANNRTDTDKTHVTVAWPGKAPESQTGGNYIAITAAIIACLGIAIVSYRKFSK